MTEQEFLKSTPRKLFKLSDIHLKLNSPEASEKKKEEPEEVYIDQIIF